MGRTHLYSIVHWGLLLGDMLGVLVVLLIWIVGWLWAFPGLPIRWISYDEKAPTPPDWAGLLYFLGPYAVMGTSLALSWQAQWVGTALGTFWLYTAINIFVVTYAVRDFAGSLGA